MRRSNLFGLSALTALAAHSQSLSLRFARSGTSASSPPPMPLVVGVARRDAARCRRHCRCYRRGMKKEKRWLKPLAKDWRWMLAVALAIALALVWALH